VLSPEIHVVDSRDGEGPLLAYGAALAARMRGGLAAPRCVDVRLRGRFLAAKDLYLAARAGATAFTCWSPGAVRAALLGVPAGRTLRAHLDHAPDFSPRELARLRARATIVAPAPVARHFEALGVSAIAAPFNVPRAPTPGAAAKAALRERLGLPQAACVLLLLADPPSSGEARRFIHECGTLIVGGFPVTGLMPRAFGMARAARLYESLLRFIPIVVFEGPLTAAAPAADLVVWRPAKLNCPGGFLAAHLAGTHASPGLRVVSPATPLTAEIGRTAAITLAQGHQPSDGPHTDEHHAMCRELSRIVDPTYLPDGATSPALAFGASGAFAPAHG